MTTDNTTRALVLRILAGVAAVLAALGEAYYLFTTVHPWYEVAWDVLVTFVFCRSFSRYALGNSDPKRWWPKKNGNS